MATFKRFNDVDANYLKRDYHIHTSWTDGLGTMDEVVKKARDLGLSEIAFTDHIRSDSDWFGRYVAEIKNLDLKNIKVLSGFEAKISNFSGELDVSDENRHLADIKIGSVHRFPLGRKLINPAKFSQKICADIELELSIVALRRSRMDILGHPGGMSLREFGTFPKEHFEEIIVECNRESIVFGLDASYHLQIIELLVPLLKKHNPMISPGSDAHSLEEIGKWADKLGKLKVR